MRVCLETISKGVCFCNIIVYTYDLYLKKNPFFIGQVKILTIHLKREFNINQWKFRHPKAIVGRSVSGGVGGVDVRGGGLMLYLDVRLGLIVRFARVRWGEC